MPAEPLSPTERLEELARGLTEAQRAAFIRSDPSVMHPEHAGRISTYGDVEVARQLYALGLVNRPTTFSYATPLGLAVRDYLKDKPDD